MGRESWGLCFQILWNHWAEHGASWEPICTWPLLRGSPGGCESWLCAEAQVRLHGPLPVHLLRHLSKARSSPGFSCKDFAVLPTHVLDLAPLWIEENQLWSARNRSCPRSYLALSGRLSARGCREDPSPGEGGVHSYPPPSSAPHFSHL